ncbi:MAG TPA: SDR family oxidoreductase [Saprospiraceae bacterium]|nr:SDR family oxidoreductase [Saprospiraceae bacterium]HMQ84253.1 SDR family oxidoreductase [Saprospiraceae bacterium]
MFFTDKVIWITGASSGIGAHLAFALAQEGAKLILSSRNEAELLRVKSQLSEMDQSRCLILPLDVSDFERIPAAVERALKHYGYINILINNAGVSQRALAKDTLLEVDQKIMAVNYFGAVALTKAVLPIMISQQFGQIVVISSVMGKYGIPFRSAYCASKHALHGFFDSLRYEVFEENIKITMICPGYVHTNVSVNALKGDGSLYNQMAEATRNGLPPDEFAQIALKAIRKNRREVYVGQKEVWAIYIRQFFPRLFFRITKNIGMR